MNLLNALAISLVLLICGTAHALDNPFPGNWTAGNVVSNPGANATLVTTSSFQAGGTSTAGSWQFCFYFSSTATATMRIELLNEAQSVVKSFNRIVPANNSALDCVPVSFSIPNGYSMMVVNVTGLVLATAQVSIIYHLLERE